MSEVWVQPWLGHQPGLRRNIHNLPPWKYHLPRINDNRAFNEQVLLCFYVVITHGTSGWVKVNSSCIKIVSSCEPYLFGARQAWICTFKGSNLFHLVCRELELIDVEEMIFRMQLMVKFLEAAGVNSQVSSLVERWRPIKRLVRSVISSYSCCDLMALLQDQEG